MDIERKKSPGSTDTFRYNTRSRTVVKSNKGNTLDLFDRFKDESLSPDEPRRSSRLKFKNSIRTLTDYLRKPKWTGGHATAVARAIEDDKAPNAIGRNNMSVLALRKNKTYKQGTFRIHFKGDWEERNTFGPSIHYTTGNPLSGARTGRSNWSSDQMKINRNFGKSLLEIKGFKGAKNRTGHHGAEIAHLRAQHAGGLTDALGAQSASWHSNVEDMAREEGQAALAKKFGDNVRIKSTAYIHEFGERAGTVKASRHKIYFWNDDKTKWEKKFDHLQDGARGNISKSEARNLKAFVEGLSSKSPNVSLHGYMPKGILPDSSVSIQKSFVPKVNDSARSPYFTDLAPTSRKYLPKQESSDVMKQFLRSVASSLPKKK